MTVYILYKFAKETSLARFVKGTARSDSYHFSPWANKEEGRKKFPVQSQV